MKILVVEDQLPLLRQIAKLMENEGYVCETASEFKSAWEKIGVHSYDLLVVDVNLPGGSGLELIRHIKSEHRKMAVIVISARDSLAHKIEGLDLGADDYITKPFEMAELLARVKSVLRRYYFKGDSTIRYGEIELDPDKQTVTAGGRLLDLTRTEYKILLFFFSNAGRVLTREGMAEHVWGDHMDLADSFDFIYSHIKNLRKKIRDAGAADPIKVVYGVGYKLQNQAEA
jgi:DNA-binding response OmpR family regulator